MSQPPISAVQRGLITASVLIATVMQTLDTTIANVALPHIQGSLSAAQDQITWVLTSYIVAAAVMMPLTGWLAGRFGRKRVFLMSVVGFTIASALCGVADALVEIVIFRLLQGICGAALLPLSQSVLLDINPPEKHGTAMAIWGTGIMVGPILGPVLGGWLTDHYTWRWVFYINLPVGVIAFLGMAVFLHEYRLPKARPFDFLGFATLSVGVGAVQMMMDRGETKDWFGSTEIWVEAILACVGFYLFIVHTATTTKTTFLNPKLLKNRNFVCGTISNFIVAMVLYSTLALLPAMLQSLYNYPVVTTGLVTAPRAVGTMLAMIVVGRVIGRIDARWLIPFGLVLIGVGLERMTHFSLLMDWRPVIVSGSILGFGIGFVFVPTSTVTFNSLEREVRTDGTAIFSLLQNVGGSIGIATFQALLTSNTQVVHAGLVEHIRPDNPLATAPFLPNGLLAATTSQLAAINAAVTRQAALIAYIDDFRAMLLILLAVVPLILLLRKPQHAT